MILRGILEVELFRYLERGNSDEEEQFHGGADCRDPVSGGRRMPVPDLCQEHGISTATLYNWCWMWGLPQNAPDQAPIARGRFSANRSMACASFTKEGSRPATANMENHAPMSRLEWFCINIIWRANFEVVSVASCFRETRRSNSRALSSNSLLFQLSLLTVPR